jgi:hypothetical protein
VDLRQVPDLYGDKNLTNFMSRGNMLIGARLRYYFFFISGRSDS